MKVLEAIKKGNGKTISVEIIPPGINKIKKEEDGSEKKVNPIEDLIQFLNPVADLEISWIDITYHPQRVKVAKNGTYITAKGRLNPGTAGIASNIFQQYGHKGIFPVPHAICSSFNKFETGDYLIDLYRGNVRNILALSGDGPKDLDGFELPFKKKRDGYEYAKQLIKQIADLREGLYVGKDKEGNPLKGYPLDFCIGSSCFPEGNNGYGWEQDIDWSKQKIDSGADYLVSQVFFNTDFYKRYLETAASAGIEVPIVPGIKIISNGSKQMGNIKRWWEGEYPQELIDGTEKYGENPEDLKKFGIEFCIKECERLRVIGAPSLHFYLSTTDPIVPVLEALK